MSDDDGHDHAAEEPAEDDAAEDLVDDDDRAQEVLDLESQRRLWLRALVPLLQLRSHSSDPSDRVQFAFDLMHIAACERVSRLCRSDLPEDST